MAEKSKEINLAELIRTSREALNISQAQLAETVGTTQQTIEKIEGGKIKHSSFHPQILTELGLDLDTLLPKQRRKRPTDATAQGTPSVGTAPNLPVRGASWHAKGGFVLTREPVEFVGRPQPLLHVREGYGIIVVDDSMSPEFEVGDVALVHPHLPPIPGATCLFLSTDSDGTEVATLKRLRRISEDAWHVRQHKGTNGNHQDMILKRVEWPGCHVIVGRYTRR